MVPSKRVAQINNSAVSAAIRTSLFRSYLVVSHNHSESICICVRVTDFDLGTQALGQSYCAYKNGLSIDVAFAVLVNFFSVFISLLET